MPGADLSPEYEVLLLSGRYGPDIIDKIIPPPCGAGEPDEAVLAVGRGVHLTVRIWQLVLENMCRIVLDGGSMDILSDDAGYQGCANIWIRRLCDCLTVDFMNFSGSIAFLNIIPDEEHDFYLKIVLKKIFRVRIECDEYTNKCFIYVFTSDCDSASDIFYIQVHGGAFFFLSKDGDGRSRSMTVLPDAGESVTLVWKPDPTRIPASASASLSSH
ncbi:hypothetical protein AA12717_1737 [Gluconacetobacter sacchari DSM 12717]|uniref:Uncharacterized protein n=2 Tax=Gluconacetobacter sacchari TaxID=92759 RepID=A0A7W4NJ71_9PROT|nr:hypothetical protein [Gluconacetobacter sacchari]MBB2158759.1 hypothetical protein [Gluconacetobacter sacchari]GBQ24255.1 hypothetical protein AA12717_1737 [Gluconacetobacter sacchari DSM 12717]